MPYKRAHRERPGNSPDILHSIYNFGGYLVLLAILTMGCGQASPQGLDDFGAKPGFNVLTLDPQNPQTESGGQIQFRLKDEAGQPIDGPIRWSATGGTITMYGLYTAGSVAGTYKISAKVYGGEASQKVTVLANSTPDSPSSSDPTETPSDSDDADSTETSSSSDDPTASSTGGKVLFADDFERGDFTVWSGDAPSGDPDWSGQGGGGSHIGDGYITREVVRSGKFAWKAMIDPSKESFDNGLPNKSSVARWKSMEGISEFYISAWYYIPTDFPTVSTLIMQAKASAPSFLPITYRMDINRELIVGNAIEGGIIYRSGVKAPLGRWFNLTGRFVIADNGLMELWLDGKKIVSVKTDTKDSDYAYPGVGNYVGKKHYPVKCHIYIDDVTITTP